MFRKLICIGIILICISSLLIACDNNGVNNENDKPNTNGIPPWIGFRGIEINSLNDFFKEGFNPILPKQKNFILAQYNNPKECFEYVTEINAPNDYRGNDKCYEAYEVCALYPKPLSNLDFYNLNEKSFEGINYVDGLFEKIIVPEWSNKVFSYDYTNVVYNAYTDIMTETYPHPYPRIYLNVEKSLIGVEPKIAGNLKVKDNDITVKIYTYTKYSRDITSYYREEIEALRNKFNAETFHLTTYISCSEFRIDNINYAIAIKVHLL